jgi:hypothetical protein
MWGNGEPSKSDEDCVTFFRFDNNGGRLADVKCSDNTKLGICQANVECPAGKYSSLDAEVCTLCAPGIEILANEIYR